MSKRCSVLFSHNFFKHKTKQSTIAPVRCSCECMFAFITQCLFRNMPYIRAHTTENPARSWGWKKTATVIGESVSRNYVTSFLWCWRLWWLFAEVPRSHTVRHRHTIGRTPLNEWAVRRVAATYTTHKKHKRPINLLLSVSEPKIPGTKPLQN